MDPETLSGVQAFAAIALILFTLAVGVTGLRLVWKRFDRGPAIARDDLDRLHAGLDRMEETERHVAELEERLDFTERMLAQVQERERLGSGD